MLVSDVTDRASEIHDEPALADVSTNDLRRFFARRALVDHDVNPRAVKAAGGWRSFEALESYLREPTDSELVDAFEAVERPSPARSGRTLAARFGGQRRQRRPPVARRERSVRARPSRRRGYVDRWNRSAAALFGYRAGEIVGTHVSTFYTDDAVDDGVPDRVLSSAIAESGHEVDGWRVHEDGSRFRATEVVVPLRANVAVTAGSPSSFETSRGPTTASRNSGRNARNSSAERQSPVVTARSPRHCSTRRITRNSRPTSVPLSQPVTRTRSPGSTGRR